MNYNVKGSQVLIQTELMNLEDTGCETSSNMEAKDDVWLGNYFEV